MADSSPIITFHVDQPLDWKTVPRCLVIRGWCFGPSENPVQAIRLKTQAQTILGRIGKPRPDVLIALSNAPNGNTGFEISAILPEGRQNLALEVQLTDGSWHLITSETVTIGRRWWPLWLGTSGWTELTFSQVSCQTQYPPRALVADKLPPVTSDRDRWPKLTIVTPSFQQAPFLPETILSVTNQSVVFHEYVVQDGGSTDGSVEFLRQIAPSPNQPLAHATPKPESPSTIGLENPKIVWASESDAGQADAIAKGFARTSGEPTDLMAWINSDDFYLPGTFAFVADFFSRHPEVDVIYGHRLLVDETSREIGRWFLPEHDNEVLRLYDFVPQETMFWRRRIWDKVGGIDPAYKFAMDWDLLLRFRAAGARIVRVPYFLACFRIHSAQKTSSMMESVGQQEIDALRLRTFQRTIRPAEIEAHPKLLRYLRRSALIRFLWRLGIRM